MHARPTPQPSIRDDARLRRWIRLVALGYTMFVVYGSLVPLRFTPLPWAEALDRFRNLAQFEFALGTRADWGANLLLFVPLAALAAAALGVYPHRRLERALRALVLVPACAVLSVVIEFTQIYFPPRVVSLNDILAQTLGTLIGLGLWWAFAPAVERWLRELPLTEGRSSLAQRLLGAYLALLFAYSLLPLDLTISPVEIYHKWREGRVLLLPFATRYASWSAAVYDVVSDIVIWIPAATLLRLAAPRTIARTVLKVVAWAALLELLQLFVFTRVSDVTDVLNAAVGGWIGVWIGTRLARTPTFPAPVRKAPKGARAGAWLGLTLIWLLVLAGVFWFPFDFHVDRAFVLARLSELSRVPFETYQQGSELRAATEVLHKLVFFAPLGVALQRLALAMRNPCPGWLTGLALLLAAAMALTVEAGQLLLPGKVADGTDAALEAIGAWLGYTAAAWGRGRWTAPRIQEPSRGARP